MNDSIAALQQGLDATRGGTLPVNELVGLFRSHAPRLEGLPDRFGQVLESLLMQLESGSLFTEESCSFSQQDLLESLSVWVDQAQVRLGG
ncbi:hypothetical protein M8A51_11830 [Schlegelella sp. S2-27]|uniref:Uncharacterized protein n=1 Tax=Caldimonas mangrovi TaxID=2944811 RepID=A0ABT0YQ09_9BURK|nr:hypothetical protein [Caldimonas mangrovi]MCM5680221.1 hypothetical protein [Caldimonas mangrovi]